MADVYAELLEDGPVTNVAAQPTAAEGDDDAIGRSDEAPPPSP